MHNDGALNFVQFVLDHSVYMHLSLLIFTETEIAELLHCQVLRHNPLSPSLLVP